MLYSYLAFEVKFFTTDFPSRKIFQLSKFICKKFFAAFHSNKTIEWFYCVRLLLTVE
jgi:hypothetical protein